MKVAAKSKNSAVSGCSGEGSYLFIFRYFFIYLFVRLQHRKVLVDLLIGTHTFTDMVANFAKSVI